MDVHRGIRVGLLVVVAAVLVAAMLSVPGAGEKDFLIYWSAARLLASGGNPYDPIALRDLEHQARPDRGQQPGQSSALWNPPWLLLLLLPFGCLPVDLAVRAWMASNIVLIAAASLLTWKLLARRFDRRSVLIVLSGGLWFYASLSTIEMGQVSSVVLIGLVLSAWCLHTGRDWLAGALLFSTTVKPHITYLPLLLALLWVIHQRRWRFLGGMFVTGAVSMIMLWVMLPGWLSAYLHLVGGHSFFQYSTSTLGGLAHTLWGTDLFRFAGILLLPLIPSLLRVADAHGWPTAMNVALLISVPLAMYGFTFDHLVLIPAVVQLLSWALRGGLSRPWAWAIIAGVLLVSMVALAMMTLPMAYYHYFAWPPLVLAGLYALAWRRRTSVPLGSLAGEHAESEA